MDWIHLAQIGYQSWDVVNMEMHIWVIEGRRIG